MEANREPPVILIETINYEYRRLRTMENKEKQIKEVLDGMFTAIRGQVFAYADMVDAKKLNADQYNKEFIEKQIAETKGKLEDLAHGNINTFTELCQKLIDIEEAEEVKKISLEDKELKEMFELFNSLGDCVTESMLVDLYNKHKGNKGALEYLNAFVKKYELKVPEQVEGVLIEPTEMIEKLKTELVDLGCIYNEKTHYESAISEYKNVCDHYGVDVKNGLLGFKELMGLNI